MFRAIQTVTLVGFGAIGRAVFSRVADLHGLRVTHIVVRPERVADVQAEVGPAVVVCSQVAAGTCLLVECAGHSAVRTHVLPALEAGTECAILSSGALSAHGLPEQLADTARRGGTRLHLLAGALAGIEAIAAARHDGLRSVTYTGRKPPAAWQGTPASDAFDLTRLTEATVLLDGSARDAARLYPKNANVAAIVALAGLGLDATRVRLVADPAAGGNLHEINAQGAFGDLRLVLKGEPLQDNPKTSALTVLSVVRFLNNRVAGLVI